MDIHEYQAKEILKSFGVTVPDGALAYSPEQAAYRAREMGGNAWEWVDEPPGPAGHAERRTRGGSWWYGAAQMRADHLQSKPPETAAVYIGFRCVRRRPE